MCGQPEPLFLGAPEGGAAQLRGKCESRVNASLSSALAGLSTPICGLTRAYRPNFTVNCATPMECSSISLANFAGGASEPTDNFATLSA